MTVTQISWFNSSKAYIADPVLVNDPAERLKAIHGVHRFDCVAILVISLRQP